MEMLKKLVRMPKAIIFDMDGTLINSTEADYLAWKRLFNEFNIDLTFEKYYPLLGKKSVDVISSQLHLEGEAVTEALARKMFFYRQVVKENGMQLIPGADALLEKCSRLPVKLGLATSSRNEKMTMMMEMMGFLGIFDAIVTGEEIHHGKPAPDIFLKAASRLQVEPTDCLVFEDAVSGVRSAKNAGMQVIAITTTHSREELHEADIVIDQYSELEF